MVIIFVLGWCQPLSTSFFYFESNVYLASTLGILYSSARHSSLKVTYCWAVLVAVDEEGGDGRTF